MRFVKLLERAAAGGRVDRAAGVIRGCKIIGITSVNQAGLIGMTGPGSDLPYSYSPQALQKAAPLYEGVAVFVDHPPFHHEPSGSRRASTAERKVAEKFGTLRNIQARHDGLYGDLHFLTTHPLANQVCEAAEKMPSMFCLSHNAAGRPVLRNGRYIIEEIADVRSVDLVGEKGGTTSSLFESSTPNPKGKNMDPYKNPADIGTPPPNDLEALRGDIRYVTNKIDATVKSIVDGLKGIIVRYENLDKTKKEFTDAAKEAGEDVATTESHNRGIGQLRGTVPIPESRRASPVKPIDVSTAAKGIAALRGTY